MRKLFLIINVIILNILPIIAQKLIDYRVSSEGQMGSGNFAPYYFTSNTHGVTSINPNSYYLRGAVIGHTDTKNHWRFGGGIDLIASACNYTHFRIQQLYADVDYRILFLSIGSKEYNGVFKNQELSSGGLIWSGNARPVPQVRAGFNRFIAIPGTNGWIQIKGNLSFGKFLDDNWLKSHFNYDNSFITTNVWYHQKQVFFRSKESKPFILTIGGEFAAQFEGDNEIYWDGQLISTFQDQLKLKEFFNVLIPRGGDGGNAIGDQAYYFGNHLGAWHGIGEYHFKDRSVLKGYFEWLFEDGSGIGKLNGWDGLWGIEYHLTNQNYLTDIVVEYLQTTNQSGPIHWAPNDTPGTTIQTQATGADDYYNNYYYNGWTHFGMSNGSPLLKSTAYNKDGYLRYKDNRVKAFHIGMNGNFTQKLKYKLLASYRRGWGTPFLPALDINHDFSMLIQLNYYMPQIKGLEMRCKFGLDRGNMYSDNTGFSIGFIYTNSLTK